MQAIFRYLEMDKRLEWEYRIYGSSKKINYNYCLDMLKGIACFCVVCMHCEFPGKLGIMV